MRWDEIFELLGFELFVCINQHGGLGGADVGDDAAGFEVVRDLPHDIAESFERGCQEDQVRLFGSFDEVSCALVNTADLDGDVEGGLTSCHTDDLAGVSLMILHA